MIRYSVLIELYIYCYIFYSFAMSKIKKGFLLTKTVSINKQKGLDADWTRRWFLLNNTGILRCYDSCYVDNLVYEIDLQSEHISHDDIIYPASEYGKPWILSVMRRERGEKLLLEADCEECMERWTQFIQTSLSVISGNGKNSNILSISIDSYLVSKPKVPPRPNPSLLSSGVFSIDSISSTTQSPAEPNGNEYEIENIYSPTTTPNEVFLLDGQPVSDSYNSVLNNEIIESPNISQNQVKPDGSKNHYEIENLYDISEYNDEDANDHSELDLLSFRKSKGSLNCDVPLSHTTLYTPLTTDEKCFSLPTHVNENSRISFHKYYEILTEDKYNSSIDSCDCKSESESENLYETIKDIHILQAKTTLVMSKRRLDAISKTRTIVRNPSPDTDRLSKGSIFLSSIPDYKILLADFWPMCFVLPNGKVYTQLINLTVCIQESLQSLLSCFQHSYASPNSYLTLQVIGDLYQTYKPHKSSKKKGIQFVEWNNSFSNQGVVTSKFVKVSMREDTDVSLSSERLEEFVYRMSHLCESEMFCMSWVSFVKGSLPVMNMSASALYSACIYLVYKRIPGNEDIDVKKFVPSHLQKSKYFFNSARKEIDEIESRSVCSLYQDFIAHVQASKYGNALSLSVKKVYVKNHKVKYNPCILSLGAEYIGITDRMCSHHHTDPFSVSYHHIDIHGWFLNEKLNLITLKLQFLQDNGSDEGDNHLIIKSKISNTVDMLFQDFFHTTPYYHGSTD